MNNNNPNVPPLPPNCSFVLIDGNMMVDKNKYLVYNATDNCQYWLSSLSDTMGRSVKDTCDLEKLEDVSMDDLGGQDKTCNQQTPQIKNYSWNDKETTLFIQLLNQFHDKLQNTKIKNKTVCEEMAIRINEITQGVSTPTGMQCENKHKSLIKKYKEIKDHNNKSGNDIKEWKFYSLMENIYGVRPHVVPQASCSSWELGHQSTSTETLQEALTKAANEKRKASGTQDKQGAKKRSKVRSELLEFLKSHEAKVEQREQERAELLKSQHADLMNLFKEVLEKRTKQ